MLPPALALIVVGTWLGLQRRSIATLEGDCALLRNRLAAITGAEPSPAKAPDSNKSVKAGAPINWKTLAGHFEEMQRGDADMRLMLRFERRLEAMTREELIAGLDEITALDLPVNSRSMLEQMLIGPLIEKDPEYALRRFMDCLQDDASGIKWHLPNALREWAKNDPAKAEAWFDQQIAAGKFDSKALDGKNPFRAQFEGVMLGILFPSAPAAAGRRVGAMAGEQRGEIVRNLIGAVKEETQAAFTQLVRDQVPAQEQAGIFAQQVAQQAGPWLAQGGYAKVTEYLERIEATPAERSACVLQAAMAKLSSSNQQVSRDDLDALREWLGTQAPNSTERITGNILSFAKFEFNDAAQLALQYSQASGNDDALGTFLESWTARNNKELALAFVGNIANEKRRAAILKNLQ
jgi:hypothetical protein